MLLLNLLVTLVPTIIIEYGVLLLLGEKNRRVLLSSVVVNVLTNVPLNLYVTYVSDSLATIAVAEMLIVVVEALWYYLFVRNLLRASVYSLLCNAISFLCGLLFSLLLVFL